MAEKIIPLRKLRRLEAGRNYSLVVYVRTAPSEYGGRKLVRRMWAGELRCHGALVLFSTARSNDTDVMREMQVYRCPVHQFRVDIIQCRTNLRYTATYSYSTTSMIIIDSV